MLSHRNVAVLLSGLFFIIPSIASAECFSRNLSLGMTGSDVEKLQQMLNTNPKSLVSSTGIGSSGKESPYFGNKTRLAVVRFQELYQQEILEPAGLSSGSGFVGMLTRKKLESLCFTTVFPNTPSVAPAPVPPLPAQIATGKAPTVLFPSAYSGVPGTTIVVSGDSFALQSSNTVYFGPYSATGTPRSASEIFVKIPDIPPGRYPLWIENKHGSSNKDAFFIVRDPAIPEPKLTSLLPARGSAGTPVTIIGTGFLSSGNELRTGVEVIPGISSSNNTSLEWTPPKSFSGGDGTHTIPVWIYVVNERGVSNPLVFTMQF